MGRILVRIRIHLFKDNLSSLQQYKGVIAENVQSTKKKEKC